MIDKNSDQWRNLPVWLKWWFFFNYGSFRPSRKATTRVIFVSHATGFLLCLLGLVMEAALAGGICMLVIAYFFHLLAWQGDSFGVWYDADPAQPL